MTALERNWAGNVTFTPQAVVTPTTVDQLQHDVATATEAGRRVRAAGARHSFSPIGSTDGTLVVMDGLSAIVDVDREAGSVTVEAGIRYADLAPALHDEGLALHNLASLPHLSVGGAVATSTHGSGIGNQSLAGAVTAIDVVTPSGDIERIERGTDLGAAAIAGLGVFGVVARVSLRVEPTFDVAQDVFVDLPFDAGVEHLDEIIGSAYSVSLFTNWRSDVFDQVWQKRRISEAVDRPKPDLRRLGAVDALAPVHPVVGMDGVGVHHAGWPAGTVAPSTPPLPSGRSAERRRGTPDRVLRGSLRRPRRAAGRSGATPAARRHRARHRDPIGGSRRLLAQSRPRP